MLLLSSFIGQHKCCNPPLSQTRELFKAKRCYNIHKRDQIREVLFPRVREVYVSAQWLPSIGSSYRAHSIYQL